MEDWLEHLVAVPYGLWIAWVGVQHFRDPAWFEPIVPGILGSATPKPSNISKTPLA